MTRVAVIGLDCAEPTLLFDRWLDELPNLRRLTAAGTWGSLRSVDPPITVPAWSCMMSGRDPGELGIYGFRNRSDHSYGGLVIADSRAVPIERVWEQLGRTGKHVIVLGVPGTYPPAPVGGELVGCFMTPDPRVDEFTYPAALKDEIEQLVGPYRVDVRNFRSDDRDRILAEIYEMTAQHFETARHLVTTRPWDFFMMVEIGLDRLHHAFWRYVDPGHRLHVAEHRHSDVIRSYYRYLDDEIGELLGLFGDDTAVFVVSDHGAQAMQGALCINEWLVDEGYLVLRARPKSIVALRDADVDWSRTRAWGEGGYYCRLCLNVKGREPLGTVDAVDYEAVRDELIARLEGLAGPDGAPMGNRVHRPEHLWRAQRRIPPDLIAFFGDLAWRSNGTLGQGCHFTWDNDTGPDDANHSRYGIFIAGGPGITAGPRQERDILDVAPMILRLFGLAAPGGVHGVPTGGSG